MDAQSWITVLAAALGTIGAFIGIVTYGALARSDRVAADQYGQASYSASGPAKAGEALEWDESTIFNGRIVHILLLSDTPGGPVPPGLSVAPAPGEMVVSPALRTLLSTQDGDLLVPRLGGARIAGTIGPTGLVSRGELRAYVGVREPIRESLTAPSPYAVGLSSSRHVTSFKGVGGLRAGTLLVLVLALSAAALPMITLTAAAARSRSWLRDARLSALWLLGVPQRDLRRGEGARAGVLGLCGCVAGGLVVLGYRLAKQHFDATSIAFSGYRLLPVWQLSLVTILIAAVAVYTTTVASRWSPEEAFAVVRRDPRSTTMPSGVPRLLVVCLSLLAILALVTMIEQKLSQPLLVIEYLAMVGVLIAGSIAVPHLATRLLARSSARWGVPGLLASSRATRQPPAVSRALSAVALLVIISPVMQGLVATTEAGGDAAPVGLDQTHARITAPQSFEQRIAAVPHVRLDGPPSGTEGSGVQVSGPSPGSQTSGNCGARYPCTYRVITDGSSVTIENLRNAVGWSGFVDSVKDPNTAQLYGLTVPQTLQILSLVLLIALIACEFCVLLGLLDGVAARVQANAGLRAIGLSRRDAAATYLLELFGPAVLTGVLGSTLGLLLMWQLGLFFGHAFPTSPSRMAAQFAIFMGCFLVVLLAAIPASLRSGKPEYLRVAQ